MHRSVIIVLLSATLALPARAEITGEDVGRALGGLAALYLLKEALEREADRSEPRHRIETTQPRLRHAPPPPVYRYQVPGRPTTRADVLRDRSRTYPDHGRFRSNGWSSRAAWAVPDRCLVDVYGSRGWMRAYGAECLRNTVRNPNLLPQDCLRRSRTHHGPRRVYGARCLQRAGWITGRR